MWRAEQQELEVHAGEPVEMHAPVREVGSTAALIPGILSAGASLLGTLFKPAAPAPAMGFAGVPALGQQVLGAFMGAAPTVTARRGRQYTVVSRQGRLVNVQTGKAVGYTASGAKKKFKKRRRQARITKKDRYEWEMKLAIAQVQAGRAVVMP